MNFFKIIIILLSFILYSNTALTDSHDKDKNIIEKAKEINKKVKAEQAIKSSNISSVSIHPGWVQTPLIKHTLPVFFQNVLLKPFLSMAGMTNTTVGSQTTLHCLIDDSVADKRGCFFSQVGIYKDKESRKGGWPMKSPNSQVYDDVLCEKLFKAANSMVGLK